jgi:uncharacterized membrane protein
MNGSRPNAATPNHGTKREASYKQAGSVDFGSGSSESERQSQSEWHPYSYPEDRRRRFAITDRQLGLTLGWFSVGLGLLRIVAPRGLGRAMGVGHHPVLMRLCGLRELASGIGLLSERSPAAFAWSRVAGDAMDLMLLRSALRSPGSSKAKIAAAATLIASVTAIDIFASQQMTRSALARPKEPLRARLAISIAATPEKLYAFWRNVENLPKFMQNVVSVTAVTPLQSHWVANAPAGTQIEWDSEIVDDQPNKLIAWRTLPDSDFSHHGIVGFEPEPAGTGTTIHVDLYYRAPGGTFGIGLARILGEDPGSHLMQTLRRLKQLVETGTIVTPKTEPMGIRRILGRVLMKK